MKCKKCGKENEVWKSGVTYKGLDRHHNPPEYMDLYDGDIIDGEEPNRIYDMITLCRDCHTGPKGLHRTIILPILNKFSNQLRNNGSENWIWNKFIPQCDKKKCREEIFQATKKWVEDGDTREA